MDALAGRAPSDAGAPLAAAPLASDLAALSASLKLGLRVGLGAEVVSLVARINRGFPGAVVFRECAGLDIRSRLAIFAVTDVLVVTAVREGLNLLPIEYMLAREHEPGALVLSEFCSLARILAGLRDIELIFIDTAGVSPSSSAGLDTLRGQLRRAGEPVTTHLCVAAATRQEELDRILHVYGRLDPRAVVATKVDEAVAIGSMMSAHAQLDVPFSYLTTGQQVPEDFMTAHPENLIDILLGGELP